MTKRYERSRKASHLDTVCYEIDMMQYAYERLVQEDKNKREPPESNMVIECFLMHYRNLLEFFSGEKHKERPPPIRVDRWEARNLWLHWKSRCRVRWLCEREAARRTCCPFKAA